MDVNDLRQIFGTISEAARALGVTRRTIYNWEAAGAVPTPYQALVRELARGAHADNLATLERLKPGP